MALSQSPLWIVVIVVLFVGRNLYSNSVSTALKVARINLNAIFRIVVRCIFRSGRGREKATASRSFVRRLKGGGRARSVNEAGRSFECFGVIKGVSDLLNCVLYIEVGRAQDFIERICKISNSEISSLDQVNLAVKNIRTSS